MASYFSYFPNVYVAEGITDDESFKYRLVKNIFRRVKARPDLSQYTTLFESYSIEPGETPSLLASRLFDDPFLDWAILLINDIVDVYEQWPKSQQQLEDFVNEKYTEEKRDGTHHWETNEILLDDGTVFIKEGIEVTESWRTKLPDGTTKTKEESIYEVTNWEYEYFENEVKRQILIPVGNMLEIMIEEFEDLVGYEPHNELDSSNNKKTELNIASRFLNNTGSVNFASAIITRPTNGTGVTYDYGPTIAGVATSTSTTSTSNTIGTTSTTTSSSVSSGVSSGSSGSSGSGSGSGSGGGY